MSECMLAHMCLGTCHTMNTSVLHKVPAVPNTQQFVKYQLPQLVGASASSMA